MTFNPHPKEKPYRCRRLLDIAVHAPKCFHCDGINDGTVVGAHCNSGWAGKGTGQKSHDLPAFMDSECHRRYDNPGPNDEPLTEHDFLRAQYKSTVWLLSAGFLKVVSNP